MTSSLDNPVIKLINASKSFGSKKVFEKINTSFYYGERVAISGPNGCGKTTLLKTIAGIEQLSDGLLLYFPEHRISYLPSDLNSFLLPWYSVSKNISFYLSKGKQLKLSQTKREEAYNQLKHYLPSISPDFLNKPIYELSTGEKAITSLTCILQISTSVFLLDEIFANTSPTVNEKLISFFKNYFSNGNLLIFTSHNDNINSELATRTITMDYAN